MSQPIKISIQRPGKSPHEFELKQGVYTVGSDKANKIILPDPSISWRHAIFSYLSDGLFIEDLLSDTGTYVDGKRVEGRVELQPGQKIQIGYYVMHIGANGAPPPAAPVPPPADAAPVPSEPSPAPAEPRPAAPPSAPPPAAVEKPSASSPERERRAKIKKQIHDALLDRLDLRRMVVANVEDGQLQEQARDIIRTIMAEVKHRLPAEFDADSLAKEVYDEALGLGPLEDLLADPAVTEIMVNGPDMVYVERGGRLTLTDSTFVNEDSVLAIIERIVSPIGRRIDESQPYVDARLLDGSRVNAIIAPLSLVGPCITIRKFSKEPFTVDNLIEFGTITRSTAEFVDACVKCRKNIVVSGGTGTGKTTVLNVLSSYLPDTERILTIEDAAELRLGQRHVVRLEARPPNIEGRGAITIRDLVRNALRMRPDRIVVGECRGPEALDMLQAMNTGHEGSLTTVHANTPRDVISRLETMVLMAGMELPLRAIREQIGAAIHMVIHLSRYMDGTRKISKITEVCGMEGEKITMQDLFEFKQTGIGENHEVYGKLEATGAVPTFVDEFDVRGIRIDRTMFDPSKI